jgi:hypothetical protein
MTPAFQVVYDNSQLQIVLDRAQLKLNPVQLGQIGQGLAASAEGVRDRAVANVSGQTVTYEGGAFRVSTRTGALKGSIEMEWPYQSWLQARVYVNGAMTGDPIMVGGQMSKPVPVSRYAASIEYGHGAIDLKKTMEGKIVPFFASRSSSTTGPYAVRGLTQIGKSNQYENKPFNNRLAAQGKAAMIFARHGGHPKSGAGAYYISFRRVGKTGWIIPAAKPRPFMHAALAMRVNATRKIMGDTLANVIAGPARNRTAF